MYKSICLIGLLALVGCAGSSVPNGTAGDQKYTLNVPNMT